MGVWAAMKNTQFFAKHTPYQLWLLPELLSIAAQVRKLVPLHVMKKGKNGLFSPKQVFSKPNNDNWDDYFFESLMRMLNRVTRSTPECFERPTLKFTSRLFRTNLTRT